jgi:hypothetical protein
MALFIALAARLPQGPVLAGMLREHERGMRVVWRGMIAHSCSFSPAAMIPIASMTD